MKEQHGETQKGFKVMSFIQIQLNSNLAFINITGASYLLFVPTKRKQVQSTFQRTGHCDWVLGRGGSLLLIEIVFGIFEECRIFCVF